MATKDLNPQRTWKKPRMSVFVQFFLKKEIVAITIPSKNLNPQRRPRTSIFCPKIRRKRISNSNIR
jgi:hypothetical protein